MSSLAKRWRLDGDGLAVWKLRLNKSSRTIRRYVQQGIIPDGYQTSGRQWRAPFTLQALALVQEELKGFARRRCPIKFPWSPRHQKLAGHLTAAYALLLAWQREPLDLEVKLHGFYGAVLMRLPQTPADTAFEQCVLDSQRQQIAAGLVGGIYWNTATHGFCQCPGISLHAASEDTWDCEVHLDCEPAIHCHSHCAEIVESVDKDLRARISKFENEDRDTLKELAGRCVQVLQGKGAKHTALVAAYMFAITEALADNKAEVLKRFEQGRFRPFGEQVINETAPVVKRHRRIAHPSSRDHVARSHVVSPSRNPLPLRSIMQKWKWIIGPRVFRNAELVYQHGYPGHQERNCQYFPPRKLSDRTFYNWYSQQERKQAAQEAGRLLKE